jgi:hypothetical protein
VIDGQGERRLGGRDACRRWGPPALSISERELLALAEAFVRARGRDPSFAELRQIESWATSVRTGAAMLPLVLSGAVALDLAADGTPLFSLTWS